MINIQGAKEFYSKYKKIIWPAASVISSVIILILVIIPQLRSFLDTRQEIFKMQNRLSILETKAENLELLDEEFYKSYLQVVFTVLPANQNVPRVVAIIQALSQKAGIILKNTNYAASRSTTTTNSFVLNLTLLGQLSSIREFLILLQDSAGVFEVNSIDAKFQKGGAVIEAEISLSVFFELDKPQTVALDQPLPSLSEQEEELLVRLTNLVYKSSGVVTTVDTSTVPLGKTDPFE